MLRLILAAVTLLIVLGCVGKKRIEIPNDEQKPVATKAFTMTYEGRVDEINHDGHYQIPSIGTNGNGSLLYFRGVNQPGSLGSYDLSTKVVTNIKTTKPAKKTETFFNFISGPGEYALATRQYGVAELNGSTITGEWDDAEELNTGSTMEVQAVSCGNEWVAFVLSSSATGGHRTFGKAQETIKGPFGQGHQGLGRFIVSSYCSEGNLYLSVKDTKNKFSIIKYSGPLSGEIDFSKNILLSHEDLIKDNEFIGDIMVVGDHLLVNKIPNKNEEGGGILWFNLKNQEKGNLDSDGMGRVKKMAKSRDDKSAIIGMEKGLVFFYNGHFVRIGQEGSAHSYKRLDQKSLNATQPVAFTNEIDDKFSLESITDVVHAGDHWYFAAINGVFKIRMKEITIQPNP